SSGCCTSPLTTYSRKACTRKNLSSGRRGFARFLDKTGDRLARLRAFTDPVLGPLQVEGEIVTLLQRLISADLLDELAIARTPAVGHHNAEHGRVLRPDPLHTNFN